MCRRLRFGLRELLELAPETENILREYFSNEQAFQTFRQALSDEQAAQRLSDLFVKLTKFALAGGAAGAGFQVLAGN